MVLALSRTILGLQFQIMINYQHRILICQQQQAKQADCTPLSLLYPRTTNRLRMLVL